MTLSTFEDLNLILIFFFLWGGGGGGGARKRKNCSLITIKVHVPVLTKTTVKWTQIGIRRQ